MESRPLGPRVPHLTNTGTPRRTVSTVVLIHLRPEHPPMEEEVPLHTDDLHVDDLNTEAAIRAECASIYHEIRSFCEAGSIPFRVRRRKYSEWRREWPPENGLSPMRGSKWLISSPKRRVLLGVVTGFRLASISQTNEL